MYYIFAYAHFTYYIVEYISQWGPLPLLLPPSFLPNLDNCTSTPRSWSDKISWHGKYLDVPSSWTHFHLFSLGYWPLLLQLWTPRIQFLGSPCVLLWGNCSFLPQQPDKHNCRLPTFGTQLWHEVFWITENLKGRESFQIFCKSSIISSSTKAIQLYQQSIGKRWKTTYIQGSKSWQNNSGLLTLRLPSSASMSASLCAVQQKHRLELSFLIRQEHRFQGARTCAHELQQMDPNPFTHTDIGNVSHAYHAWISTTKCLASISSFSTSKQDGDQSVRDRQDDPGRHGDLWWSAKQLPSCFAWKWGQNMVQSWFNHVVSHQTWA